MVQSIGPKPISASDRPITAVARVASPSAVVARGDDIDAAPQLSGLAQTAAATAPVNTARVAALRQAIQSGSYQIDPERIADSMLSMKQEWQSK